MERVETYVVYAGNVGGMGWGEGRGRGRRSWEGTKGNRGGVLCAIQVWWHGCRGGVFILIQGVDRGVMVCLILTLIVLPGLLEESVLKGLAVFNTCI